MLSEAIAVNASTLSGRREHGVAARCTGGRNFFLHDIPMLDYFAALNAEDVDRNHRLWSPAGVAPMNHDEVAIRGDHARFIGEAGESRYHGRDGRRPVRDYRIVLFVVFSKVLLNDSRIAVDKGSLEHFEHDLFV
jgi:hypothetical protein